MQKENHYFVVVSMTVKIVVISTTASVLSILAQLDATFIVPTFIPYTSRLICLHDDLRLLTSEGKTNLCFKDYILHIEINERAIKSFLKIFYSQSVY